MIKTKKEDPAQSNIKANTKPTSKDKTTKINWISLPKKWDFFVVRDKLIEGKVTKITSNWHVTVWIWNREEIILAGNLWDQIDQKKGYYTNTKTKTKYDWEAIKLEFLESDYNDVAPFLADKYQINTRYNTQSREKAWWWWEEKKKIKQELKEKALEEFKSKLKDKWTKVFDKLEQAHVTGLEHLADMILGQWELERRKRTVSSVKHVDDDFYNDTIVEYNHIKPYLGQYDMISILKHIKLEKWEPTEIFDNQSKTRSWLEDMKKKKQGKDYCESDAVDL